MPDLASPPLILLAWALAGYLLGSVPFGLLVARAMGLGDVRAIGSGNIGATNVLRTGSRAAAALTLLLDGGKGALAVVLARAWAAEDAGQVAGLAALGGHCFPVWLGFRGGKGVATALGLLLAVAWPVGVGTGFVWLATALAFRFSSLAALAAAVSAPLLALLLERGEAALLCLLAAALVVVRHRANIARLRAGAEPRIGTRRARP